MKYVLLSHFLLISILSQAQFIGNIQSFSPMNPNVNDTVEIVIFSDFPQSASNGPQCGTILPFKDTTINSKILVDTYFEFIPLSNQVASCWRYDTINFVADSAGIFDLKVYWSFSGIYLGNPFNIPRDICDSVTITIGNPVGMLAIFKNEHLLISNFNNESIKFLGSFSKKRKDIRIYNLSGQMIFSEISSDSKVNISKFDSGLYIVIVNIDGQKINEKLLISK